MSSIVTIESLSFYETRALLMFVEVHNDCSILSSEGKFQVEKIKWHPGGKYSISVKTSDPIGKELIENELNDVRVNGCSMVDPSLVDHEKVTGVIYAQTQPGSH